MFSSEQILEQAARDGSIDVAEWPRVLENVLQRLHQIVHSEFPLPRLPLPAPLPSSIDPDVVASTPPQPTSEPETHDADTTLPDADEEHAPISSQASTKENDAPTNTTPAKPPVPKFDEQPTPQRRQLQPDSIETQPGTLPPDLLSSYQFSAHLLSTAFAQSPPYTIQRLAELVLYPRKHYRFLPAYLRALDRVVSVSSPVSDFPLPTGIIGGNNGFLTNGEANPSNGIHERNGLGSDESLGGALLTPIPWLGSNNGINAGGSQSDGELHTEGTETIQGPNGAGSIETVSVTVNGVPSASSASHTSPNTSTPASPTLSEQSDASTGSSTGSTEQQLREQGGVTQGELLRQEQEAGVIPVAQTTPRRPLMASGAIAVGREGLLGDAAQDGGTVEAMDDRPEDHPHARGPEIIGMEDMGPQHVPVGQQRIDMQAAVGRSHSSPQPVAEAAAEAADAMQEDARADDAGEPGRDPQDVERDVEMLKGKAGEAREEAAKDSEGDIVVADADGRTAAEARKDDESLGGGESGPDAVDTTAQ